MAEQRYLIEWQGIELEALYTPVKWSAIAHLELRSINPPKAPLPMTETGYRSHFHPIGTIEAEFDGDVVACVTEWLNNEAKSKKWKSYIETSKQADLFS
ncbi:MAG: hypothetical protein ACSHXY_00560 [Alphaproteobacteria bacterium]